ncbi:YpiF family protein [Virgibacillus alimentarius]|uniref:DUF2487 domain-containing protein n=1 Tax=Virgibacillus alimentarius TaxID=698769 RepID=A0ABS4S7I1_9BACI|nr:MULTISPECIES: YpiF family protein [Virgibacillus]MBP2256372.1 hypothetical protein [Virgibacillus alimentarius]HLR66317.1 YpiF family protein [Virgibacillus sp.]
MKWNKENLKQYVQAKEYVDTIVLPLMPFHLSQNAELEKSAFQREVLSIFLTEIEQELTGRIMLTPDYNYLKSTDKTTEVERINAWIEEITTQPFEHIFLITFDSTWKKHEESLNGHLLWLPGIQSGDLHSKEMHTFIHGQVEQISELIQSYW